MVKVSLKVQLDYETRSTYRLGLKARDGAPENELTALATVSIDVTDVQDQPPLFINSPYSATVPENTPAVSSCIFFLKQINFKDSLYFLPIFLCIH